VILLAYQRAQLQDLLRNLVFARLAIVVLMVIVTWGYPGSDADVLRSAREGVFFFLMTGCAGWRLPSGVRGVPGAANYARLLCFGLLVLVLVQTLFLSRGVYFGIPQALFSQNGETIAGELDLYYSDIRPNGPYGEPSYLGGVCLCLLFAFSPLLLRSGVVRGGAILAVLVVILSRSFSGIVFCLLMAFTGLWGRLRSLSARLALAAAILSVCMVVGMIDNTITARLDRLRSGEDRSSMARVVQPLAIIPDLLIVKPTGMPMHDFVGIGYLPTVGVYAEELSHNAILNLILNYGWIGVLAILVWMYSLPDGSSRLFVSLLAMQNGAVLSPDKFVLISLSMMIYNSCRTQAQVPDVARVVFGRVGAGRGVMRRRLTSGKTLHGSGYRPVREVEPWP
jgi:hypothetical protein